MATWKERFEGTKATFKGIPFVLEEIDLIFGRELTRFDVSKAPTSGVAAKITGKKIESDSKFTDEFKLPREFEVTCSFYGTDYIESRDAFMEAVEEGGAGLLVFPNHRPLNVLAGRGVNRFDRKEGGTEKIRITFAQADDIIQPDAVIDYRKAAKAGFLSGLSKLKLTFVTDLANGARNAALKASTMVSKATTGVLDALGVGAISDALEACTDLATDIAQAATTLIYTPSTLAGELLDLGGALNNAFVAPQSAFKAQKQIFESYGEALPSLLQITPEEIQIAKNQTQYTQLIQNSSIIYMGVAITESEYASLDEAQEAFAQFEDAMRTQQLVNGDTAGFEQIYYEMANILALVGDFIKSQNNLPSVVSYTYQSSPNAFQQAYDLYGDTSRYEDLAARNSARNPLFLSETVEALSF